MSAFSEFDRNNLHRIIFFNYGDNFAAYLARFLHVALSSADSENIRKIHAAFPEECNDIYRFWKWPQEKIDERFQQYR